MRTRLAPRLLFFLAVVTFCSSCVRDRLLYQASPIAIPSSESNPRQAIRAALLDYNWIVEKDEPGEMIARQRRGQHEAYIKVTYDDRTVRIRYHDSDNLLYELVDGEERIHERYNIWIRNLEARIAARMS